MTIPTDPLYAQQWHFSLIGDIQTIWDEYSGNGVSVGIFDDGVEPGHPDLAANYDPSRHFEFGGTTYVPTPNGTGNGHGTAVAGIIGAVDNNGMGGVGVAHGSSLTGVELLGDVWGLGQTAVRAALDWARNFDVMNNSWGFHVSANYSANMNLSNPGSQVGGYNTEFGDVVANGRGGLGTTIIQAAGNDHANANAQGLNASRYTTTIAATDAAGNVQSYSNFGSSILIAAPASSVTTDREGSNGYNGSASPGGDYTTAFGGTSAATPTVAGVVALMLEANPDLGWRDVQNIMAISASQTGSAYGSGPTGFEVGSWGSNGATGWNGGGMTWHPSYGFGMVDAFAAVRMSEVWSRMFGDAKTSANEQSVSVSYTDPVLAIPDLGTLEIELDVTQNIRIEDIYVTVDMQHNNSADLVLTLVGPNGEEFVLMNSEGGATLMDGGFIWTFGVTGALDTFSAGTWILRITDNVGTNVGTVDGVSFDFFGSVVGVDDVYHFTQDLFGLIAVEAARATVTDSNGGIDWLNFAAMGAIDISVNLNDQAVAFSTTVVSLTLSGVFENVVTGDGNDTVTGNGASNTILGMRGEDRLMGEGGDDILEGGAGADELTGGTGQDEFRGTMAEINGDSILDYENGERIVITDASLQLGDISIVVGSTIVSIDGDGDGIWETTFTLNLTFSIGDLALIQVDATTTALVFDDRKPDIEVQNVSVSQTMFEPGDTFSINWDVANVGDGDATESGESFVYLSQDQTLDGSDTLLRSESFGVLTSGQMEIENQSGLLVPTGLSPGIYVSVV